MGRPRKRETLYHPISKVLGGCQLEGEGEDTERHKLIGQLEYYLHSFHPAFSQRGIRPRIGKMAIEESHTREDDMAADSLQDMSLEQQRLVGALIKALDAIAARLRRVPLDDEKQASSELTDILDAVRAVANAVT